MVVSCALRDAGNQVTCSVERRTGKPHSQTATRELTMAAEHVGILMLAEIALRKALTHGRPKPASSPRKKAAKKCRTIS
jgi:hypothetical protein